MLSFGALTLGVSALPLSGARALDDLALPSGGTVTGGSASFDYSSPGQLHVHQGTDRAVIDWDSFNIGRDALTEFHQPSASSMVINRVTGNGDPTQILGAMRANGTVMVLDRNGVIFGENSRVDVGGIIVSTGDVDTAGFMNGDSSLQITGANTGGEILNRGTISVAEAGLAAFVAPTIRNSGVIEARMGRVMLASGAAATLDLYGDGLVEVAVDQKLQNALIDNSGTIAAQGGTVLLTAAAAKDVVNTVINTSGIISASSATVKGGKIILEGANIAVSGTLDASGAAGGGEILVGGDYLGSGTVKTANKTTITETATLTANTTGADGGGGKVIVWSDDSTLFQGTIEARGGSHRGNGGFVETSGKINLGVSGSVDASSPNGLAGEWLLDPQNVRISNGGANSVPVGGGVYDPSGVSDPFQILASSISAALSSGNNVTITTTNAGQAQAGTITVNNATILKSGGSEATLTLKADADIVINGNSSIKSDTDKLNIVLWSGANNGGNERINIHGNSEIDTNGGEFFAGGGADDGHDIADSFGNALYNGSVGDGRPDYFAIGPTSTGISLTDSTLKTGDGNVTMLGQGGVTASNYITGVGLNGGTIETHDGNVLLIGRGGNNGAFASHWGVAMEDLGGVTVTGGGTIRIDGTGGTGSGTSYGIYMKDDASVLAKDGAITVTAKGGTGGINNHGFNLNDGSLSANGNSLITIIGDRGDTNGTTSGIIVGATGLLGSATTQGNINLITDRINIGGTVQSLAEILIKALDPTVSIGVAGGAGDLNLTDTEMNYLNVGTKLIIGDSVNGTGDMIIDSWDLSSKTYDVELYANDITIRDTDAAPAVDYALELGVGKFMAYARDSDNTASPADRGDLATQPGSIIRKKNTVAGTSTLDLRADGSISLSGQILAQTGGTEPKLNILINSNRDNGAVGDGGAIVVAATGSLKSNGGTIALTGGNIDDGSNGGTAGDGIADGMAVGVSNYGVYIQGGINAGPDGNIQIAGRGYNQAGIQGHGVLVSGTTVKTGNGKISIRGQGGNGTTDIDGILFNGATIEAAEGSIDLRGTGGGGTDRNNGVVITNSTVRSIGTGNDAATIYIEGQQGGTGHGGGVSISGNSTISSEDGDIRIKGTGGIGTTSSAAEGIRISGGSVVKSIGTTADAAQIFIDAQGGGTGTNAAHYGFVLNLGSLESSVGKIDITATGGNGTSSNHGLYMEGGASPTRIESSGSAEIIIRATGGNATQYAALRMTNDSFIGEGSQPGAASGNITFIIDGMDATPTTGTISTLGDIYVTPKTTSTNIGLGYNLASALSLNDTELAMFNAGEKFVIGDAVNGTGDVTIDSWNLSAKTHDVEIYGNDILVQDTDGAVVYGINMGAGDILLQAKDSDNILTPADAGRVTISNANITRTHNSDGWLKLYADETVYMTGTTIQQTDPNLDADNDPATNPARLNVIANANRDEQTDGGRIVLHGAHVFSNGGTIAMVGGNTDDGSYGGVSGDGISDGLALGKYDGANQYSETGIYMTTSGNTLSSGAGNIYMFGEGETGSSVNNVTGIRHHAGTIQTTTGDIILYAKGGTGTASSGMGYYYAGGVIETVSGNIDLTSISMQNAAATLMNGGIIRSTGEGANLGDIRLKFENKSFEMRNNAQIYSKDANIYIEAPDFLIGNYAGTAVIGDAGTRGNIVMKTNAASVATGRFSGQTSGIYSFIPVTPGRSIGLSGGAGQLSISDNILSNITAGTLVIGDAVNGTGDITVDTWDLSGKSHHVQLFGNDITVNGITTGAGNVYMYAKDGAITVSGDSNANAAGNLYMLAGRDVSINEDLANTGAGSINVFAGWDSTSGITANALFDLDDIDLTTTARDITLGANGRVSSGGAGTAVLLVASDDIVNNATAGANAIAASAGRYLAYATHPTETIKNGLTAKNLYGRTYDTHKPSAIGGTDNRFVFGYTPTLTLTANSMTVSDLGAVTYGYTHSALVAGDQIGDAVGGAASYTLGALHDATRAIHLSGLSSPMGYILNFVNGTMTLTGAALTSSVPDVTPVINHYSNVDKVEDTTTNSNTQAADHKEEGNVASKSVGCLLEDANSGGCLIN